MGLDGKSGLDGARLNGAGASGQQDSQHRAAVLPSKSMFGANSGPRSYPKIRLYRPGELSPIMVSVICAVISFVLLLLVFLWLFTVNHNAGLLVVVALFGPFLFAGAAATTYDRMLRDRLRRNGRSTEGYVVDLWTEHDAGSSSEAHSDATEATSYFAAYQFNVGLGSQAHTLTLQESVKEEIYSQLKQGQVVRIFYIEDQPEVALVEHATAPGAERSL